MCRLRDLHCPLCIVMYIAKLGHAFCSDIMITSRGIARQSRNSTMPLVCDRKSPLSRTSAETCTAHK